MARKVIIFNRGSKRRLRQIRWKMCEIITLALFALLVIAITGLALLWEIQHTHRYSDPPNAPQIKEMEPSDP